MEKLRKDYPIIHVMYNASQKIKKLGEFKYKKKGDDPVTPVQPAIREINVRQN